MSKLEQLVVINEFSSLALTLFNLLSLSSCLVTRLTIKKSLDLVIGVFLLWFEFLLNLFAWQCKLSTRTGSYHPRGIGSKALC